MIFVCFISFSFCNDHTHVMNRTYLHIRHSFPRLRQAARATVPTTYERDIGKDCSTGTAVRPGRRSGSHWSVALDKRQGDASSDRCSHKRVSPHRPTPYLEKPDWVLTDGRSHGQLLVWVRTQRQVPLTGCCSRSSRKWLLDDELTDSSRPVPMDGRSHDWSSVKRSSRRQVPVTELYLGLPLDFVYDDMTDGPVFPHVECQWMGAPMIGPRRSVELGVRFPWLSSSWGVQGTCPKWIQTHVRTDLNTPEH